jgi:uncharacterized protein (DUF1697 family)
LLFHPKTVELIQLRRPMSKKPASETLFIALLRAVNLGGTRILAMKDLSAVCTGLGFANVRTFIQSGNVLFRTAREEADVCAVLEKALTSHMKTRVDVFVRTASEMERVLSANPFPDAEPSKVIVVFLPTPPPKSILDTVVAPGGERVELGRREIYIYYPNGIGRSKLKIKASDGQGTARNINTVRKLVALAAQL